MAIPKHLLTRRDWDKHFGVWSMLFAGIAITGSIAFGYHALWAVFVFLAPLFVLMRFSTPTEGYDSPQMSRWTLLVIPVLFVLLPTLLVLVRYAVSKGLR